MKNIVLVGFMGAGKSTIGRSLSREFSYKFVDLDELIVKQRGKSIPDIFSSEGETAFRSYETQALQSVTGKEGIVLSTGGGAVGRPENIALMQQLGPIVYLRAGWEALEARILGGEGRPLTKEGIQSLKALLQKRLPLYEQADYIVDSDRGNPQEVSNRIVKLIGSGVKDA